MPKVSIEQQVAELTPEQRNKMGGIYKKYIASIISILLICLLVGFGFFAKATIREDRAKEKYDRIQTMIEVNERTNKFDFSLYEEKTEAFAEYCDARTQKSVPLMLGSGAGILGFLVVFLVFKKKYPYFSEKKYNYLKKLEKSQHQNNHIS